MNNPEIIIVPVIFFTFAFIIKMILEHRLKRLLVEKGKVSEDLKLLQAGQVSNPLSSVKWGLVLVGIGLAFLFHQFMPYTFDEVGVVGLISFFAGCGFLIYYAMFRRQIENQ